MKTAPDHDVIYLLIEFYVTLEAVGGVTKSLKSSHCKALTGKTISYWGSDW